MFLSEDLYQLFSETYASNQILAEIIREGGVAELQIVSVPGLRPTRRSVLDASLFVQVVGGVNHFPSEPDQELWSADQLDSEIDLQYPTDGEFDVGLEQFIQTLSLFSSAVGSTWDGSSFVVALNTWAHHRSSGSSGLVIVRRGRDVSAGTGTLLSPNDREIANGETERPVLVVYRLNGARENMWNGHPFWVPNVKLPSKFVFNFLDQE